MSKKNSKNNNLLNSIRDDLSPKLYNEAIDLVNKGREDLAEEIPKIDYILEYTSKCIKVKDFREAKEAIDRAEIRINKIKEEGYNVEYLEHLFNGIKKKVK